MNTEDIEHTIDRHEEAITQDAKSIAKIQKTQALIVEVLSLLPSLIPQQNGVGEHQHLKDRRQLESILSGLRTHVASDCSQS